jgi:hypothetical protein
MDILSQKFLVMSKTFFDDLRGAMAESWAKKCRLKFSKSLTYTFFPREVLFEMVKPFKAQKNTHTF